MNQDQYHASLLNKNQPVGLGWDGITKASTPKVYPPEKPNTTDVEDSIKRVKDNDHKLTDLNWNNIKVSAYMRVVHLHISRKNYVIINAFSLRLQKKKITKKIATF